MIPTLRNYQEAQLDAIVGSLLEGVNRVLIQSPTGTGKTVTFAMLMQRLSEWLALYPASERRMLVLAHREELLDQAAEKIRRANPGLLVAVEQGARRASVHVDVVVASIQTLAAMKFRRLERLMRRMTFRIVIVDEAHHAAALTYRHVLAQLGFLPPMLVGDAPRLDIDSAAQGDVADMARALTGWDRIASKDQILVGFTATPNRSDAVGLGCVFQTIAYSYPLKQAIEDGWLVPVEPWVIETDTSLENVHVTHGELNQRELADAVNTDQRNQLAVAGWRERAEGLPTIAFTVDVAHAVDLAAAFTAAGYRAASVSGITPKEDRRRILAAFQDGRLDVLTNCMVLTEGTDLPRAACILHAKPTKSATLYEQMTGRGLRLFEGKTKCVLIDLVDVARRHSLQSAPVLYGLPPGLIADGQSLDTLGTDLEALREEFPRVDIDELWSDGAHLTLAQLRARAVAVNPWRSQQLGAFGDGRTLQWTKVSSDEYQIEYPWIDAANVEGFERVKVFKDVLDRWEVELTFFEKVPALATRKGARRSTIIASQIVEAGAAGAVAEGFILQHRQAKARMLDTQARWRGRSASAAQLGFLAKLRIPHDPETITAGQASNLIDQKMAIRRARR